MKNGEKLVSIIVPVFNLENYISECLDTLVEQTYQNLEILVVDDGSSDSSWSLICDYQNRDSRIKGIRQENGGVSKARNTALAAATGDYILFVDGDDYISFDAIEKLMNIVDKGDYDLINFQYQNVDAKGDITNKSQFITGLYDFPTKDDAFVFIRDSLLAYKVGYEVWGKIFKADIIRLNKIRFNEHIKIGEDLAFNIHYCMFIKNAYCSDLYIYNYRLRDDSAMQKVGSFEKEFREHLSILKDTSSHLNDVYGPSEEKDYQLFSRLMDHAYSGKTPAEIIPVLKSLATKEYLSGLNLLIRHKSDFKYFNDFWASMRWRYSYYLYTQLNDVFIGKLYFAIYDFYRKLRGQSPMKDTRMI